MPALLAFLFNRAGTGGDCGCCGCSVTPVGRPAVTPGGGLLVSAGTGGEVNPEGADF